MTGKSCQSSPSLKSAEGRRMEIGGLMRKILTVVGLTAALMPAAARAQTPEEQIRRSLERAAEAGVPVSLLQSKIDEGRAKGIPVARIAAAVTIRLTVLERVKIRLAAQNLDAAELGVAADAAQAGVSDQVLLAITQSAPKERRAVAVAALTQLVQMGHGSEEALQQVTEALQRGPDALMNLPAQAAGRGQGPGNSNAGGNAAGSNAGGNAGGAGNRGAGGAAGPTGPGSSQGQGGGRGGPPPGVPTGGSKGATGPSGVTGPKGGTGMTGPKGPTGKPPGGDL